MAAHRNDERRNDLAFPTQEILMIRTGLTLPVIDSVVSFASSDRQLLRAHRDCLRDGFEKYRDTPMGAIVDLPEKGETLALLWDFITPGEPLPLDRLPIGKIVSLAEVAGKYGMQEPETQCHHRMKQLKEEYPLEIIAYAHRTNHLNLMDEAAPFTLCQPPQVVRAKFSPVLVMAWSEYTNAWRNLLEGPRVKPFSELDVIVRDPGGLTLFSHLDDGCRTVAKIESAIYRNIVTHGIALLLRLPQLREELTGIASECKVIKETEIQSKIACTAMVNTWIGALTRHTSDIALFSMFVDKVEGNPISYPPLSEFGTIYGYPHNFE